MADLETKVERLDERVSSLEQRVSETTANVNALARELKDFKDEMRDRDNQRAEEIRNRDNQRAEEIREIRESINAMQNTFQTRLDGMGKHVRNLVWTGIAAIGGIAITVIYSLLKN